MARTEIDEVVQRPSGRAVAGASVRVNVRATGDPATVFAAETGSAELGNPLTTDSAGRIDGWLDIGLLPVTYDLVVAMTGPGGSSSTYTQPYTRTRC